LCQAITNGHDAVKCWISAAKEANRTIPKPGDLEKQSGKWVQRVPKSIHLRLVKKAEEEGVSLNTLVITLLAEALGKNNPSHHTKSHR
jgi:antitoxin HicB